MLTEARWHFAWYLLSLDRVQPFFDALWVPLPDENRVLDGLREQLKPWLAQNEYSTERGRVHHAVARWFRDEFGMKALADLRNWTAHVLIVEGADRATEFEWRSITRILAEEDTALPPWIAGRMSVVVASMQSAEVELESLASRFINEPLSGWDQEASRRHRHARDDIDTAVNVVCGTNSFVSAWNRTCADLSHAQLVELFAAGRHVASERGIERQSLQFPSSWTFDLVGLDPHP